MIQETSFFNKSMLIANDYLQNIVFLDDKAFENNTNTSQDDNSQHTFDSYEISKVFAAEKKVCAVYRPTIESDINLFKDISKKADIVILDWQIILSPSDVEIDLTADADDEDPRGQYTKQIIKELVQSSGYDNLKLVVVYTGDDIFDEITKLIYQNISKYRHDFTLNEQNCEVSSSNIRILVRGKSYANYQDKFKQRTHLLDKVIPYEQLPSFILTEFTLMTSGILSNFALSSLATIRRNSSKILNLFSKNIDPAYMGHKAILPTQNDSEELLLKLFGDTITDLLNYSCIPQGIRSELIDAWIDSKIADEQFSVNGKVFQRTKVLLKKLIHSEKEILFERLDDAFNGTALPKSAQKTYVQSKSTELFLNLAEHTNTEKINSDFAKLTHHKSLFLPKSVAPKLTLGTILRSSTNQNEYFICIQQRCDSVRLKKDEVRKFLFLPLNKVVDGNFQVITPDGDKLQLDKKSYSIKTIKFTCNCDEGEVKGVENDKGRFMFKEFYDKGDTFEWVLDLKDLHSQRIVTNYVSTLSRIGLDESEWLRIAGTQKN